MAEYLIREESLVEIADAVRTYFEYYDGAMQMITNPYSIETITIPDSVITVGIGAFFRCNYLTDIYLYPTVPPTLENTSTIPSKVITIHVPLGSGSAYKNATNWSSFADKIVEDIEI